MIKRMNTKGQETLGISFGVIFSIILIIFFIVVAGIVIRAFLGTKDCAETGIFVDRFESEVKKTWNSQSFKGQFKGNLPTGIEYVCFGNLSNTITGPFQDEGYELGLFEGNRANTFFYPPNKACGMPYIQINHLDVEAITRSNNPNCIPVVKGKVIIDIEKGLTDRLVNIDI